MQKEVIAINGQFYEPAQAKISVFDRGFLYGDSIYEVTRSYDHVLFALEDHVDRLFRSAENIGLDLRRTPKEIIKEIYRVYHTSGIGNAYMRIVVTRGEGPILFYPKSFTKPNIIIYIRQLTPQDKELYKKGMDVIVAGILRNPKASLDPNTKSGNYLNNVLAMGEAQKRGAHDAIMLNRDGFVTEGTLWNVFMVKDGAVHTAPNEADILHGITRKILKKICLQNKIWWEEKFFTPDELKKGEECFATGSVKELMPINSVDGVLVGGKGGLGPVTKRLTELYHEYISDYCMAHKGKQ